MTHAEALQKLTSEHRVIIERMIAEKPRPLESHEKAALDEFVEFLRKH